MVWWQVCCQCLRNGGLGMPNLKCHWLAERLAYRGWSLWFLAKSPTPKPKAAVSQTVPYRLPVGAETSSVQWPFLVSKTTVSGVSGGFRFGSSRGATRLVAGGDSLSMVLDTIFRLLEQLCVFAYLAACTGSVGPCWLGIQSVFGRHDRLPFLWQWPGRNGFVRILLLRAGLFVSKSGRRVDGPHRSQTARVAQRWLRRGQCWPSVSRWKTCGVSRDASCG